MDIKITHNDETIFALYDHGAEDISDNTTWLYAAKGICLEAIEKIDSHINIKDKAKIGF